MTRPKAHTGWTIDHEARRLRCPEGHEVRLGAYYCPRCIAVTPKVQTCEACQTLFLRAPLQRYCSARCQSRVGMRRWRAKG